MEKITSFAIPIVVFAAALCILISKKDLNASFTKGARDGIDTAVKLVPTMIILMSSIFMLNASGAIELFSNFLSPFLSKIGIPSEMIPLILIRPVSGSAATAMLNDIFNSHGTTSLVGRCASVLAGSTDTILYTIAVYFSAIKVRSTRHAIPAAFLTQIFAIFLSCAVVRWYFNIS